MSASAADEGGGRSLPAVRFVVGGVVPPGNLSYRTRAFESRCFGYLAAGEWVTLLGPRQHGKTSGLVRLRAALRDEGFDAALVDLQAYTRPDVAEIEPFLDWLVLEVRSGLELPIRTYEAPTGEVAVALDRACDGAGASVALLFDEATHLHPAVQHSFYSQLRAIHTATRGGLGNQNPRSLAFLFSGTFRPESVIDDDNSPFNVSRIVLTEDLAEGDATALASEVGGPDLLPWATRAYGQVGGQPYLLQLLLEGVLSASEEGREAAFAAALNRAASGADGHLPALLRRVSAEAGADELVGRLLQSNGGIPAAGEGLYQFLEVVGVAKTVAGSTMATLHLVPRNPLYERAMRASPRLNADQLLADAVPSAPAFLVPLEEADLLWVRDAELRQVIRDVQTGAVTAINAGQYRLALAGLGATYEGMLVALVEQLGDAERDTAKAQVTLSNGRTPTGRPGGWSFEALVGVAHVAYDLRHIPKAASETVRDWRNLVHPDLARRRFQSQELMQPEAIVMAAHITKLLQAVPRTILSDEDPND